MTPREEQQARLRFLSERLEEIRITQIDAPSHPDEPQELTSSLQHEYNSLHNNLAFVSSLPDELLAAIFKACHGPATQRDRSEFQISHVIRRWRYVSLDTPSLWTSIVRSPARTELDLIAAYLARSKTESIDVLLYIDYMEGARKTLDPVCELLAPHLGRLRQLDVLTASRTGLIQLLESFASASAPRLKSIGLINFQYTIPGTPRRIFTGGAPSLTLIHLLGIDLNSCLPPTESVSGLKLVLVQNDHDPHRITVLRDNLNAMPALTYLEIESMLDTFPESFPAGLTIEMPALRSLSIHFTRLLSAPQLSRLLMAIESPNLHALNLSFEGSFLEEMGDLDQALALKFTALNEFHILYYSPRCLRKFAQVFPSVTLIYLEFCTKHNIVDFLPDLNPVAQPPAPLWPNLHSLSMRLTDISIPSLHETLVKRKQMGFPIGVLSLNRTDIDEGYSSTPRDTAQDIAELDSLREVLQLKKHTRSLANWSSPFQ